MTIKKKSEEYALEKCKECYMCNSEENGKRGYCPKFESRKEGYIAGAKENGVIWHRVKKYSIDLPGKGTYLVVIQNQNSEKEVTLLHAKEDEKQVLHWIDVNCKCFDEEVIAWSEIPKFEEEEEPADK